MSNKVATLTIIRSDKTTGVVNLTGDDFRVLRVAINTLALGDLAEREAELTDEEADYIRGLALGLAQRLNIHAVAREPMAPKEAQ